jgi:hypothetical protein
MIVIIIIIIIIIMEYIRRLRLILNTDLNAKHKMQAIGSLAIPILRYSFEIINWHEEEIQRLD